ncbi:MAG: hypothetical protein IIC84_07025 [Chloroflexi bacterium]|nr:hypothetical protein [Chloroflexota bacterium]
MKDTDFLIMFGGRPRESVLRVSTRLRLVQLLAAGAGLDVFEKEPADPDNPLLKMDNVVVSPHSAGTTWDALFRRAEFAYANIERVANGEAPLATVKDYTG